MVGTSINLILKMFFCMGILQKKFYMEQPPGFVARGEIGQVCRLRKSLYDLKQSPRTWFDKFSEVIDKFGQQKSKSDHYVFYRNSQASII